MSIRHLFRGSRTNRDRRDQAFAQSVIAEATRRYNMEPCDLECGDRFFKGQPRCRHNRDVNESMHSLPSIGFDIAASNARQNDYWRRVGGHPDAGEMDGPEPERCAYCNEPLGDEHDAVRCAINMENDNAND